jgi:hypothetical protein
MYLMPTHRAATRRDAPTLDEVTPVDRSSALA